MRLTPRPAMLPGLLVGLVLVAGCGTDPTVTLGEASPSDAPSAAQESPVPTEVPTQTPTPAPLVSAGPPSTHANPTTSPAPGRPAATVSPTATTTVVTDASNGSTIRLRRGQRLEVRLTQDTYDAPVSSAQATVVRRSSSGGYPSSQPVDAVFEALAAGSADVTAQTDYACFHTAPRCMRPTMQWSVHVIVT
jgi:hypothetical protein